MNVLNDIPLISNRVVPAVKEKPINALIKDQPHSCFAVDFLEGNDIGV